MRICINCGVAFKPRRASHKFCGNRCAKSGENHPADAVKKGRQFLPYGGYR